MILVELKPGPLPWKLQLRQGQHCIEYVSGTFIASWRWHQQKPPKRKGHLILCFMGIGGGETWSPTAHYGHDKTNLPSKGNIEFPAPFVMHKNNDSRISRGNELNVVLGDGLSLFWWRGVCNHHGDSRNAFCFTQMIDITRHDTIPWMIMSQPVGPSSNIFSCVWHKVFIRNKGCLCFS